MHVVPAALALLFLLHPAPPLLAAQDGARISFQKRVYSEERDGKKVVYRPHEVQTGESLWKILSRGGELDPAEYGDALKEFRRLNPSVKRPSLLAPGEKILVPLFPPKRNPLGDDRKAEAHRVRKGETLSGILSARGIRGKEQARHIAAILSINPNVKDADRIYAGSTLYLPTEEYFLSPGAPEAAPPPGATAAAGEPAVPLDRNAAEVGSAVARSARYRR